MKKNTPQNFSKRLVKYGALSVAIAGIADASGQIVYTDVADEVVGLDGRFAIDLDNNTGDYLLGVNSAGNFAFIFPVSSSMASAYNSNAIVGFLQNGYAYPSNLLSGAMINSTNGIFSSDRGDFNFNSCAFSGSQFCDGLDGYLGFHFKIGSDTHYGWARIQVATDASSITLKDYAYESTAGIAIAAGDTGVLGIDDNELIKIKIVALNKNIALFNLPQSTNYRLFSITGQSVLDGKTTNNTHVIDANTLATGVYIIELEDAELNAVIRKKIIL